MKTRTEHYVTIKNEQNKLNTNNTDNTHQIHIEYATKIKKN